VAPLLVSPPIGHWYFAVVVAVVVVAVVVAVVAVGVAVGVVAGVGVGVGVGVGGGVGIHVSDGETTRLIASTAHKLFISASSYD